LRKTVLKERTLKRVLVCSAGWLVLTLMAGISEAAPLTFQFTGTVTQINTDPADPFSGAIGFGTPLSGSYTFDDAAADGAADSKTGSYASAGLPFGLSLDIAGFPVGTSDLVNIGIADDFAGGLDQYTVFSSAANGAFSLSIILQDFSGIVFSSDALPLIPPNLAGFLTRDFHLVAEVDGNAVQIDGTIDSLTTTVVPEPSALALAAGGLVVLMAVRRVSSRQISVRKAK
jgi:hypothetical protein